LFSPEKNTVLSERVKTKTRLVRDQTGQAVDAVTQTAKISP